MSRYFRLTALIALASVLLAILLVGCLAGPIAAVLFGALMLVGLAGPRASIVLLFVPTFAWADTGDTKLDLTQVAIAALPFVFGIIAYLIRDGLVKLATVLKIGNAAQLADQVNPELQLALAWAQSKLADKIAKNGLNIDVKNETVALAGQFMAQHAQQKLDANKIDAAMVAQKLEAMIALNTTPPEQSIALPTPAAK